MFTVRGRLTRVVVVVTIAFLALTSCSGLTSDDAPPPATGDASACPDAFAAAQAAVARAVDATAPWAGPTTGPPAATGKTVVYIAQTMTNPGVAGVAKGVTEAAGVIGWQLWLIDGQGTPGGLEVAFEEAIEINPDGIIVSGFDPDVVAGQVRRANAAGIPLVGWHAVDSPGPSQEPELFTNITTNVADVAEISAQWTIHHSGGTAGVVIFTDSSIPFAENKSRLIERALARCAGVRVLATADIPIPEASNLTPQEVTSLIDRFGEAWTHSVAINDLYFADAAPALERAGKQGTGPPFNIGAGDGDPVAFQRIRAQQYQTATVPEPMLEQGWQLIDELNRALANQPSSGYVAPVHLTTTANVGNATFWEPDNGYRDQYAKIWGK